MDGIGLGRITVTPFLKKISNHYSTLTSDAVSFKLQFMNF